MDPNEFDLEAYLRRINFSGSTDVSLDTLARLHQCPFPHHPL
jgi:arylamine N-acetyltransferase